MTLLLALLVAALPARAPLAIVPLVISGPDGALTSIQSGVLSASAYRADLAPMRDDESFARSEIGKRIEDCGDDDACVSERLAGIGARYGLVIVVNAARDYLGIELIDAEAHRTLGQHLGPIPGEPLVDVIRARVAELFERAGFVEWARLSLRVSPAEANVQLDGPTLTSIKGDTDVSMDPGPVRVSITLDGYESRVLELVLERGKTASATIELVKDESLWSSPWLWIGAAGVVTAGVITAAAIAASPGASCVCLANPGEVCATECR